VSGSREIAIQELGIVQGKESLLKNILILVLAVCLAVPVAVAAQETAAQEKKPSPFQIYSKDQTPENFVSAYNAYAAQMKDTADYAAAAMLAWLSYYELERNLETLKSNEASLTNMNKFQYANILLELGRYEEAIPLYTQLNEKTPKWSCPWRHKGEAYFKMKNYAEAEKALLKAIETRKEHYDAYIWLAEVYRDMGQYDKGIKTLEEGLTYYGKDIEDPEKEYSSVDVAFLHLDLLKKAGKSGTEEYRHVLEHAKKLAPEDERLKQY
jgi:tetratricopeptide (TPR) repeat protein